MHYVCQQNIQIILTQEQNTHHIRISGELINVTNPAFLSKTDRLTEPGFPAQSQEQTVILHVEVTISENHKLPAGLLERENDVEILI
jgi:hypothetical protein